MTHGSVFSTSNRMLASSSRIPGFAMILLGIGALVLPTIAGIEVSVLFGATVFLAGIAYGVLSFNARQTSALGWRLLVSIVFSLIGIDLLTHPGMALATTTLLVAVAFLIEGIAELASFFIFRENKGSAFLLINGCVSLVLAITIWRSWPSSSTWAIGTLIGVNLITTGLTRLRLTPPTV